MFVLVLENKASVLRQGGSYRPPPGQRLLAAPPPFWALQPATAANKGWHYRENGRHPVQGHLFDVKTYFTVNHSAEKYVFFFLNQAPWQSAYFGCFKYMRARKYNVCQSPQACRFGERSEAWHARGPRTTTPSLRTHHQPELLSSSSCC